MNERDQATTVHASALRPKDGQLVLTVLSEGLAVHHPLPDEGVVLVGRSDDVDVSIDDPRVSRRHVILHLGNGIEIEACEAQNGTRIGDEELAPGKRLAIEPGQTVEIGGPLLVVQRRERSRISPRLWPMGYFELRIEEECARRKLSGARFTVLWLAVPEGGEGAMRSVAETLLPGEIIARYARTQFFILLEGGPMRAKELVSRLEELLLDAGPVSHGTTSFPKDGQTVGELLELARPRLEVRAGAPVVHAAAMEDVYQLAERVARGKISVLILGETGSGKELLAQHVHDASPRSGQPFLKLNCAAITETLLESELFGHEKGAFTGANARKKGLLEAASGGTLFLDEVGEMSASSQVKLLRALESGEITPLGSTQAIPVDVRFVSATNRDLEEEVERGSFREDLFYRLQGVTLNLPPLRERRTEIPILAERFAAMAAEQSGEPTPDITDDAMRLLLGYSWPGNVRELRSIIERAVLLQSGGRIDASSLPAEKLSAEWTGRAAPTKPFEIADLRERDELVRALEDCGGNQTRAAEVLRISRRTLLRRLEKFDLPRPRKR